MTSPPTQASQGSIRSTTSAPSPPSPSPDPIHEPPLETLIAHLLASKRSLSTIDTVWRANSIVRSAQSALEESVILSARSGFLRRNITDSTRVLRRIRKGVEEVYREGEEEFGDTLKALDDADAQLKRTMDMLRGTVVEGRLRPEGEARKNLLDFVDPKGVEVTRGGVKESIDLTQDAQAEFLSSINSFATSLHAIKSTLKPHMPSPNQPPSPLPNLLTSLEAHAHEMAALLSSLVSHFDLCVNAIKHTEGGLLAVHDLATTNPESADVAAALESSTPALMKTIPEEERLEMIGVMLKDAGEVDDVVLELNERGAEMETEYATLLSEVDKSRADFAASEKAYALLVQLQTALPAYVAAAATFRTRWADEHAFIAQQMGQLSGIKEFYESYLAAYDAVLVEAGRRRDVEARKEAVMLRAVRECERIAREDEALREAFWGENKEWLPADLWVGVGEGGRVWGVHVEGEAEARGEEGAGED